MATLHHRSSPHGRTFQGGPTPTVISTAPPLSDVRDCIQATIELCKDIPEIGWFNDIAQHHQVTVELVREIAYADDYRLVRVCPACRGRGFVKCGDALMSCACCKAMGFTA